MLEGKAKIFTIPHLFSKKSLCILYQIIVWHGPDQVSFQSQFAFNNPITEEIPCVVVFTTPEMAYIDPTTA